MSTKKGGRKVEKTGEAAGEKESNERGSTTCEKSNEAAPEDKVCARCWSLPYQRRPIAGETGTCSRSRLKKEKTPPQNRARSAAEEEGGPYWGSPHRKPLLHKKKGRRGVESEEGSDCSRGARNASEEASVPRKNST